MSIKEEEISGIRLKQRQKALQKELSLTVALSKQLFGRWSCIFYAQKTLSGPSRNLVVGPIPYIIWTHQKAEMSNVQYVFLSAISHNNGEVFLVMTNINNIQKTTQKMISHLSLLHKVQVLQKKNPVLHPSY